MILASIEEARRRGASPDAIIAEIARQNPKKATSFQEAQKRGASADSVLKEVEVQNYLKGLGKFESGGSYTVPGVIVTKGMYKGDRAYGKYQVMGTNIPSWTKEHLGRAYTIDEYVKSPQAQDSLARKIAEKDYDKYGNWPDVASKWFTGGPFATAGNVTDDLGTNTPTYIKNVVGYLPQSATTATAPKKENYGAMFPSSPTDNPLTAGLKAAGNVPSSFFNLGKNIFSLITNPVETAKGLFHIAEAVGNKVAENTIGRVIKATTGIDTSKQNSPASEETLAALSKALYDRYGTIENAAESATNDPAGVGSDILAILSGGAGLVGKTAQLNKAISTTAKVVTKPVAAVASKTAAGVSRTTQFGVSQATGLEPSTVRTVIDQPSAFSKSAQASSNRASLGNEVKGAIDTKIAELADTGKGYEAVRGAQVQIFLEPSFLETQIAKHGLSVDDAGKVRASTKSVTRNQGDLNAIQNIIDNWKGKDTLGPDEFLNLRSDLADLAKYDATKTPASATIARDLRAALNEKRNQVPGLKELDAQYAPQVDQLKAIKRDYIDSRTGELKDGAASKIANLTGAGKAQVLDRLEEILPGVTPKIKVLKAVEDIERSSGLKVGTYARAGIGVAAGMTGNIPLIVGAILAQPQIAVPLIRGYGFTKQTVAPVLIALRREVGALNNFALPPAASEYFKKNPPSIGLSIKDVSGGVKKPAPFKGYKDLTTKLLEDLKGRSTVSRQYILDATNRPDLKQAERDLFRRVLADMKGDPINVKEFADRVKTELLPLERLSPEDFNPKLDEAGENYADGGGGSPLHENVVLPDNLRGPVANYSEYVYESPIETMAGRVHFAYANQEPQNYFAHTRIEDLPNIKSPEDLYSFNQGAKLSSLQNGSTRRVIEIQSDLFQKGRLEEELRNGVQLADPVGQLNRADEVSKLEPYRNIWWERVIREEVKQAAKDGKTKLQFPTGETAMKIEGLGNAENRWYTASGQHPLKPEKINIGDEITMNDDVSHHVPDEDKWIITDVLGDGKFKAIPKSNYEANIRKDLDFLKMNEADRLDAMSSSAFTESFDISGKIDTNHGVYRRYEKLIGPYLKNKYGAKIITDAQGVKWWEFAVSKNKAKLPVEAFGVAPVAFKGAKELLTTEDEE